jgi:hypothetical protein
VVQVVQVVEWNGMGWDVFIFESVLPSGLDVGLNTA